MKRLRSRFGWQPPPPAGVSTAQDAPSQATRNLWLRIIIGVTTVGVSVSAYYSYQVLRNLILEQSKQNAFLQVAQGADEIDGWLGARKAEVQAIAQSPATQSMDWTLAGSYLKAETQRIQDFDYFVYVQPSGAYHTTLVDFAKGKNLRDRLWVQKSFRGEAGVANPLIARTSGKPQINVYSPIGRVTQPVGALAGAIGVERMNEVLSQLHYGSGSYAFALNSKGEAIIHPDKRLMSTVEKPAPSFLDLGDKSLAAIARRMTAKESGIKLMPINDTQKYVAYAPLQEANWSVALVIPRDNIEARLRPLDVMALVVAGLTGTLIGVLWQVQAFEQAQLKKSKAASDAANRAKSEFLANMSHELRTPLNGILGYAQILGRTETLSDRGRKGIEIIYQCGSHLLNLINDVLDLAKIEARKMELFSTDTHFPSFLDGVAEISRIRAEQKGISFDYQPDASLPTSVLVDEKRLRQVLINLLGNAIKFTDRGGVTFEVKLINRRENSTPNGTAAPFVQIHFAVHDTGVGMTPSQLQRIFLPFEQVGDKKRQVEGTGLGLAITQQIITLMGSTLQVSSQPDQGSTFWFEIELPESQEWAIACRTVGQGLITGYQGDRRKILVVDDKWENRSVLVNLLEMVGFELAEASDGQEGLQKAETFQPDLIITDLLMPIMTGYEFIKILRQTPQFQQVPIIASSASVFELDENKSLDEGADVFLPKPVQADRLLELLKTYLKIEWIYRDQLAQSDADRSSQPAQPNSSNALIFPSADVLHHLLDLAKEGNTYDIAEEAESLKRLNPTFIPFANQLIQLSETFQVKRLQELLQSSLSP